MPAIRQRREARSGKVKDTTIVKTGTIGSIIAAICSAKPVLVIALGAPGLSAWLGRVDYVLIPALVFSFSITASGLWRQQRAVACYASGTQLNKGRA